jgi:RNA polymerase sigma factor (sigma-70 family)
MNDQNKRGPKEKTILEQRITSNIKSDRDVWLEFLNGSEAAIADLYSKFVPVLYNYGMHIINHDALVNDTIQDVFFELIDKKDKLAPATSVKFYLMASFRRRLIRQITRDKKLSSEQDFENSGFTYKLDPDVVQLTMKYSTDEKQIIEKACNSLPKRQREAIMLYFFEELTYQQMAEVFNFSHPKNARTLVYRALDTLSQKLKSFKNDLLVLVLSVLSCYS